MTDERTDAKAAELAAIEGRLAAAQSQLAQMQELLAAANSAKAAIEATQGQVVAIATDVQTKQVEVQSAATMAGAAKAQIADAQAQIATKSQHIEEAKAHADTVRTELTRAKTNVATQVTEVDAAKGRATAAADAAKVAQEAATTAQTQAETSAGSARDSLDAVVHDAGKTKKLADIAVDTEARVSAYEKSLAALEKQSKDKFIEINGLLPGATSAGLAHAFDSRGKMFTSPADKWQKIFVGSIAVLIVVAGTGLLQIYLEKSLDYPTLLRLWLARMPIAGALVWLALYASKEAALAKRLEEDYAYKAAISTSFQGFQEQMKQVQKDAGPDTPLGKLCADTLATIASPPGRIYDKHSLTTSPSTELVELAKAILNAAGKSPAKNE